MEDLTLKVRILSLWLFVAVAMSAHAVLYVMEPGAIDELMSGEMLVGPWMLFFMALFWWIPLVMAFLSVTLRDHANCWTNMVVGVVFVVLNAFHLSEHLAQPSAHQVLLIASTVVAPALILWYALKWRRTMAKT
jgi:hypothetical protein